MVETEHDLVNSQVVVTEEPTSEELKQELQEERRIDIIDMTEATTMEEDIE